MGRKWRRIGRGRMGEEWRELEWKSNYNALIYFEFFKARFRFRPHL